MTTRHRQLCKDIENDVRESGRSVLCIGGEVDSPPFAYTIGNALKGLPELLMIGTRMGGPLNDLSEKMLGRGRAFDDGEIVRLLIGSASNGCAKKKPVDGPKAKKSRPVTHSDALVWWSSASPEARSRFIDGVGLKPLLAAIPPSWQREAEQAIGPVSSRATRLLKLALSTNTDGEVIAAIAAVKRVLAANRYDLHDVEIRLNNQNHRFGRAA